METRTQKFVRRPKAADITDHWAKLIEGMRFSTQEFYIRVEAALQARQVPGLAAHRVGWKEGGPLTARREYLRLRRERLIFDLCAMPFGSGFYVSEWFGEQPHSVGVGIVLLALLILFEVCSWITGPHGMVYQLFVRDLGMSPAWLSWSLMWMPLAGALGAIVWFGTRLDDVLIRTPVVGYIYERYFRRITYYRLDQTCAYKAAVHAAVCEVIDEISKSQGIAPLSEFERRPAHRELISATTTRHKPRNTVPAE